MKKFLIKKKYLNSLPEIKKKQKKNFFTRHGIGQNVVQNMVIHLKQI